MYVTNLKTSKESGSDAEAADIPREYPIGNLIEDDWKQILLSRDTLKLSSVCWITSRVGRPRLR